jgi:ABC-2 type transport system ATP-binding protein
MTDRPPTLASNEPPLVDLRSISKTYEPTPRWMRAFARTHIREAVRALESVDLLVRPGEICTVVGPNGAGKTTLFRIIVGLTTPTSGEGRVMGLDVERESVAVRQVVGWMPSEERSLLMRATCKENLQLHGRLQGIVKRDLQPRISETLEVVGLGSHRDAIAASLSAGQKARLRLARALLPGPRVLLLDEPTGAIDPVAAHSLLSLIQHLTVEQGLGVLISSHRLEEIEALQSNSLLMDGGRVRYSGDLGALRDQWEHPQVELTFSAQTTTTAAVSVLQVRHLEHQVNGNIVLCRLTSSYAVGDLLADLGPLTAHLQRIRELPMPLRDFIARVYRSNISAQVTL